MSTLLYNKEKCSTKQSRSCLNSNFLETKLSYLFNEELNRKNSIFLKINKNFIPKMTMFLSGAISRPASIALAGETASGKSTITLDIINTLQDFSQKYLEKDIITRINADDYYYDRSEMVKQAGSFANFAKNYDLDTPEALELELMKKNILELLSGKSTFLPKYDMSGTAIRYDNHTLAYPSPIIISEGLFVLNDKVVDAFDFKCYVDVTEETKKQRFYARAAQRNLADSADSVYQNAVSKAQTHILPTMKKADIIISGEADRRDYIRFLEKLLFLVKGYCFETLHISRNI